MAKKASKHPAAARPAVPRNSAGWGFWLICFAALYGPSWFLAYRSTVEREKTGFVPWVTAFALAAVGAGLLSFAANYALRSRAEAAKKKQGGRRKKK
jgi:hypothetical protein